MNRPSGASAASATASVTGVSVVSRTSPYAHNSIAA